MSIFKRKRDKEASRVLPEFPNGVSLETAKEVLRLSELYLDGTIRLSLAADTRAMQLSGAMAAAAGAFSGIGLEYAFSGKDGTISVGIGLVCAGVCFFITLLFALSGAKPRPFHINGNYLEEWTPKELHGNLAEAIMSQAAVSNFQIHRNNETLSKNAMKIRLSLYCLVAAPLLGTAVALVHFYLF